jgi:shikimate dehydrogenase
MSPGDRGAGNSRESGSAPAEQGNLYFVGVSTTQSNIMTLFPAWADHLGLDAKMVGVDLPLRAAGEAYRDCVASIAADPGARGALVTTHKSAIFDHARDVFDELDRYALLCREISCMAMRESAMLGWAKDPVTAGQAIDALVGPGRWRDSAGDVVCFGAGGAGLAISVSLLSQADPPERLIAVDRDPRRITISQEVHHAMERNSTVEYLVHDDVARNDALLQRIRPGSLVINATGMGKDLPGAPISSGARFPFDSVVWDLNYRGELEFLSTARQQADSRGLVVEDGWRYFLHGWTEVIAEVFDVEMTPGLFRELGQIAEQLTGRFAGTTPGRRD